MAKTDKLRKVLWIILATLSIISLVFGLMKKVGLCASDSSSSDNYMSSFPLRINPNYGMGELPSDFDYNQFMSAVLGACPWSPDACVVNEVGQTYIDLQCFQFGNRAGFEVLSSTFNNFQWRFGVQATVMVRYTFSSGNAVVTNTFGSGNSATGSTYNSLDTLPDQTKFVKQHTFIFLYPVYVASGSLSYNGITYFENWSSSGGGDSGDTSFDGPGFSEGFQDWIDSDLNPVDINPPTTDTTPNWLQKILNGLSTINDTIGGGFSTVFGWFGTLRDSISDKIDSFKSSLSGLAGLGSSFYNLGVLEGDFSIGTFFHNLFFCDPQTIEDIWDDSETGAAVNDLKSTMGNIIACYTATPSEHVYWNFDFSNTTLFSNVGVISINFDWYNAIRTPVITLFSVFFFLGFLFLLVRKIPGIISGLSSSSDDK